MAWIWRQWGVSRRTILAMLLIGWVATELASDIANHGRVSLVDAAIYAAILAVRALSDGRTPAAVTAARRHEPLLRFVRLMCWGFAVWDASAAFFLPAMPVGVAAAVLFVSYIYATDTLTPKGPPGPKRKEKPAVIGAAAVFGR